MTINELREKRNQAWEAAKAFVETKRNSDGLLSDEDAKTYAQMEKKVQDYGAEIERMEAMSAMDAQLSKPTSTPITEKPMNGTSVNDQKPKTGRASDAYKDGMLKALRTNFRQVSNVLQEGIDADGGYLVPEEYDSRLIEALEEENIFRKLGHTITTSGERKINIAATKPAAAWIDEGEELTWGDAKFAQINLDAHKLHVAVKVTEELLYDNAFQLEKYILRQFAKALANAEEDAFLNGTGVGQPLGLLAEEGGAQIGVTAASATEITADELIDLVYSLKRPYRKNAKFICNIFAIDEHWSKSKRFICGNAIQFSVYLAGIQELVPKKSFGLRCAAVNQIADVIAHIGRDAVAKVAKRLININLFTALQGKANFIYIVCNRDGLQCNLRTNLLASDLVDFFLNYVQILFSRNVIECRVSIGDLIIAAIPGCRS